jgi:hypothetical protein
MKIEVKGKVTKIEDEQTFGSSSAFKRTVVLTEEAQNYSRIYAVDFWNVRPLPPVIALGAVVNIPCYVDSKEHNGRYYTQLKAC